MINSTKLLIKKSERYLKTDMLYLVGQSGWLFVGQGSVFISSLLLAWVFANFLTPSDYGLYKFVIAVATIASLTTFTGIGIALSRAISQGHEISLFKVARIRILLGLLGTTGLFGVTIYYLLLDNKLLASLFAIAALTLPFYETLSDYQFFLQGKKDFKTQTIVRIIQRVVLSAVVILTILLSQNIVLITSVFFISTALSHGLSLIITTNKYPVKNEPHQKHFEIYSYATKLSLQNVLFVGATQLDKLILFKFLGPAALATYYFALAIPQEINGLLGNVNAVAFPKLVDKQSLEFKIALIKKIMLFTLFLLIPISSYILIAPYLFEWFFPAYMQAVLISQLFIGIILFTPASLLWHYFYATNHSQALWFGTFVGPLSLIGGMLLLIPLYGLVGAVLATYIRSIIDLLAGLYFFFWKTHIMGSRDQS